MHAPIQRNVFVYPGPLVMPLWLEEEEEEDESNEIEKEKKKQREKEEELKKNRAKLQKDQVAERGVEQRPNKSMKPTR